MNEVLKSTSQNLDDVSTSVVSLALVTPVEIIASLQNIYWLLLLMIDNT
jgi:hypothetical protein